LNCVLNYYTICYLYVDIIRQENMVYLKKNVIQQDEQIKRNIIVIRYKE